MTFVCLQEQNAFSLSPLALVAKAESLAVLLLANSTLGNQKLGEGRKAGVSVGGKTVLPLLALAGSDAFLWLRMLMLFLHSHGSASGCEISGNLSPAVALVCLLFYF